MYGTRRRPAAGALLVSSPGLPLWALLVLFVGGCSQVPPSAVPGGEGESPTSPPNILLLMADDLDYEDLGAYGSRLIATPRLDRLASQGMRFTSFYANGPICTPTRVSILTGRYPQRFGLFDGLPLESTWGLPAGTMTMPQLLREAGYETAHVGKWHVGHSQEHFRPLALGFDHFYGFLHAHQLPRTYRSPRLRRGDGPETETTGHLTDLLAAEAERFLRSRGEGDPPFFLNVWFFSPHKPLEPPQRWRSRYDAGADGLYGAMVSSLDENVGRILDALEETGLTESTLVLFLSDNGGVRRLHSGRNARFSGAKDGFGEGGIRVPLIARWPGRIPAGAEQAAVAATFDLAPTLVRLAGGDPARLGADGRSMDTLLAGGTNTDERTLFWFDERHGGSRFAMRKGPLKLRSDGDAVLLFDLLADPGEQRDLSAERPEEKAALQEAFRRWQQELPRGQYPLVPRPEELP